MRLLRYYLPCVLLLFPLLAGSGCDPTGPPPEASTVRDVDPFLDTLEARTFQWFWDTANPENGLVPDRWPRKSFSSIAAVGFGLTAYGVGVERGYITRAQAVERTLTTLRFFWEAPQGTAQVGTTGYKGFFYHFLDMEHGRRYASVELSTIDTVLLLGGVLFAREYFDRDTRGEAAIRAYADSLFQRVEWDWFMPRPVRPAMGWYPEIDFGRADWQGYNEAMLLYVMALGTPTFALGPESWDAWTSTYEWGDFYGYEHVQFSPLFGHQYSHVWIDFRGIQDAYMRQKGIDYFENARRATLSQRAYAIDNPGGWKDYGEDVWGLTACDGPADVKKTVDGTERQFRTYWARGASLRHVNDDGTIAPTAAGGSIPFAPEVAIPALKAMRARYGDALFTEYGFLDAFNPSFTFTDVELRHGQVTDERFWVDGDYLGIDQGPILLMAENYRSEFVWRVMRKSPYLVRGLKRAGFTGGWLDALEMPEIEAVIDQRQPTPEAARAGARLLVVLGSSTAEGVGPQDPANTWVNRYRAYARSVDPSVEILNLARGGYTTYHLLPTGTTTLAGRPRPDTLRNITRALTLRPAAIVINLPSNDAAAGFSVADQLRNYDAILARAEAAGVPVWITTTLPRNLDDAGRRAQMALRDSTLARYGRRAIDIWTGIARPDGTLDPAYDSGDRLHLNDAAHALLFERVRAAGVLEAVRAGAAH